MFYRNGGNFGHEIMSFLGIWKVPGLSVSKFIISYIRYDSPDGFLKLNIIVIEFESAKIFKKSVSSKPRHYTRGRGNLQIYHILSNVTPLYGIQI